MFWHGTSVYSDVSLCRMCIVYNPMLVSHGAETESNSMQLEHSEFACSRLQTLQLPGKRAPVNGVSSVTNWGVLVG